MSPIQSLIKIGISIAAVVLAIALFCHSVSEAIHIVIASEPPPAKMEAAPRIDWQDCGLTTTWQSPPGQRRCQMELSPPAAKAQPIQTMTKEQSETASIWFIIAAFAFPLALGAAALIGFVLFRSESAAE